jgi:hypothetical protein
MAYINDPTISKDIDVVSDLDKYSDEMTENEETTEATGAASAGAFSSPLFTKEETKEEEKIPGGLSKDKTLKDIAKKHDKKGYNHIDDMLKHLKSQLMKGIKVEMEHTNSVDFAMEIAKDHLFEDPNYYDNLKKIEATEATTTASSGQYSTPAFVAKNDKNWRGGKKPIYKGGKFAQVKKKCLTFPYCNQGAGAVVYKNKSSLDEAIKNVSTRLGVEEQIIKRVLYNHFKKKKK